MMQRLSGVRIESELWNKAYYGDLAVLYLSFNLVTSHKCDSSLEYLGYN